MNTSAATYVGWQWKGSGTTVSNTNGSITSTVCVNPTAGFSIAGYTGTGANATVGHGLGVAPKMVIVRTRNQANNWNVYHADLTSAAYYLGLNLTNAQISDATAFNSTAPTSTVFSVGTLGASNANGINLVAYSFAPIAGYSAFGSYTGNSSADGTFVYLGFRPRWVMLKNYTSAGNNWYVWDSARGTYNPDQAILYPNTAGAEASPADFDLLSNGFKPRLGGGNGYNDAGVSYIYAAFAESPFKNSLAR
jgi:hypothetical protein